MIFNHEDGNWKNSEVARVMMEILASRQDTAETSSESIEPIPFDDSKLFFEAKEKLNELTRTSARHLIINELNKIAETVQDNPQASLDIELAIEDIKDILK